MLRTGEESCKYCGGAVMHSAAVHRPLGQKLMLHTSLFEEADGQIDRQIDGLICVLLWIDYIILNLGLKPGTHSDL